MSQKANPMRLRVKRTAVLLLLLLTAGWWLNSSGSSMLQAQNNLLTNGGLNGEYVGTSFNGINLAVPPNWNIWWTDAPSTAEWQNATPISFRANNPARSGESMEIGRGQATFTAAIHQTVDGIAEGTRLRATGYAYIRNASGAVPGARIGIGSNTGGNPLAGNITWSGWQRNLNSWQEVSVEAVVPAGSVTVFMYATQTWPNDPNVFYFDDISLVVGGTGEEVGGEEEAQPEPEAPPPPPVVPFVVPQGPQDDGSVVHTVVEGDTVNSIAVAYGVRPDDIIELNNLGSPRFIRIGQRLRIRPAGSVEVPTPTLNPALPTPVTGGGGTTGGADDTGPITGQPAQPTSAPGSGGDQQGGDAPDGAVVGQPAQPTPAPGGQSVAGGPLPSEGLCVMLFEDRNQNGVRDVGENPLPDATIELFTDSGQVAAHRTDGREPFCFNPSDVGPGTYFVLATAPEGFTLTTPTIFNVNVIAGARSNLIFGAAREVRVI
jgi:LysM repeat protein